CGRSIRILGTGEERGPGCVTHEYGHAIEGLTQALPRFESYFDHFANFDLDQRLSASFDSFYYCEYYPTMPCLNYLDDNSVYWRIGSGQTGPFDPYDQGCGNTHFAPNSVDHYDYVNPKAVLATCEHYGLHDGPGGADLATPYTADKADAYEQSLC